MDQERAFSESMRSPQPVRLARILSEQENNKARKPTHDSNRSRQALQGIMQQKRRNDLIRRSELEHLRILIQHKSLQKVGDVAEQLSIFHINHKSTNEGQGGTLRKINEIEAQMSRQWWKSTTSRGMTSRLPDQQETTINSTDREVGATTQLAPASAALAAVVQKTSVFASTALQTPESPTFVSTLPAYLPAAAPKQEDTGSLNLNLNLATKAPEPVRSPLSAAPSVRPSEPRISAYDLDLEEAAIFFANGDWAGAENNLREVLKRRRKDVLELQHEVWMTLFDLFRATGQKEDFDILAIDYAAHVGRSAPLWFSLPEQLGLSGVQETVSELPDNRQRALNWSAQPRLSAQSVTALRVLLTRAAQPWTLNWQRLTGIEPSAVKVLAELFENWGDEAVELHFVGAAVLLEILESYTQVGDNNSDTVWWRLRLAILRLMGQKETFENVAIDYCVTYEISPPSWIEPHCLYSDDNSKQMQEQPVDVSSASAGSSTSFSFLLADRAGLENLHVAAKHSTPTQKAELFGHIEGDATAVLEQLSTKEQLDSPLVVSCERLIRVDFVASGTVLNWAATQQAQGRVVQFTRLHRLVAVFFHTVGINEYAQIITRKD